jgi:hypothetical protein
VIEHIPVIANRRPADAERIEGCACTNLQLATLSGCIRSADRDGHLHTHFCRTQSHDVATKQFADE